MHARVKAFLRLSRIEHGVMSGLAVIAGALSTQVFVADKAVLAALSAFFAETSLFAFNDVFNVEEDKVNNPTRPIVAGEISLREALLFAIATGIMSVVFASAIGPLPLVVIALALGLGILYDAMLKRHGFLGNLIVAGLTAFTFPFGAIAVTASPTEKSLLFFAVAFLANVGREIVKGIRDLEGDMKAGICTLPCEVGEKPAGVIAAAFMSLAVVLSFSGLAFVSLKHLYLALILVTDVIFAYSAAVMALKADRHHAEVARRITLPAMLLAIVAFTLP